jgi:predicted phage baseplate assembly protein
MALDPVKLDDLNWSEMVIAARRRIAAASGGRWTLHAPVDPGITLTELFSWLLEQRLFWMDQVPDSLIKGALRLLDEAPQPTQVATTVMHFSSPDRPQTLPALTELTLLRSNPPLIFSTDTEIVLLPFEDVDTQHGKADLFIDGNDRTSDLESGKVIKLFPAGGGPCEIKIILRLRHALTPDVVNKRFSLLFDLRTPSGIAAHWSPKSIRFSPSARCEQPKTPSEALTDVPPPAKLKWFYRGADGKETPFGECEVDDGTGGLRRKGLVTLPIKIDWQPEKSDGAHSTYNYALWIRVEQANFSAPPRLQRLIPNVVIASHRRKTVEHLLRREWLPLPGNVIAIGDLPEDKPMKDYPPIENTVQLQIKERDGAFHPWQLTSDLAFHGPTDRVFVVDRERCEIDFGDGLTGRLPVLAIRFSITERSLHNLQSARVPDEIIAKLQSLKDMEFAGQPDFLEAIERTLGREEINRFRGLILKHTVEPQFKLQYFVGGGSAGKLGAALKWEYKLAEQSTLREAINVVASEGGAEAETMAAARERIAHVLKQRTRAVTREDYKEIALNTPGIAIKRAHPADAFHPAHPCTPVPGAVTVFVVPDVPRPDVLSEDSEESDGMLVESAFVAAPVPDPGALAAIRMRLNERRLVASEVFVSAPRYRPIALAVSVETDAADRVKLGEKIKLRLRSFLDPLIGGDEAEGWPFGEPLRPSTILRQAQRALGNEGNVMEVSIRLLDDPARHLLQENQDSCDVNNVIPCTATKETPQQARGESCYDVDIGPHDLVELRQVILNFSRPRDNPGGLR